jgi:transglutaminase-like putative cysteine protease
VHAFTINAFHRQIRIVATSVVETERATMDPRELPDVWPTEVGRMDYALYDYLAFRGPVCDSPLLRQVIDQLHFRPGERLGSVAMRIVDLINERFTYKAGVTTATSPITEMLEHGYGVCQDFTHLMIGLARAINIPARYVSGFLHPVGERFKGFTQTHAWCELFFPSQGWLGFDPANKCAVADNFVAVAVGRDYFDVPAEQGDLSRDGAGKDRRAGAHGRVGGNPRRTCCGADAVDQHPNLRKRRGAPGVGVAAGAPAATAVNTKS